jgi:hypothetical protein
MIIRDSRENELIHITSIPELINLGYSLPCIINFGFHYFILDNIHTRSEILNTQVELSTFHTATVCFLAYT